MGGAVSKGSRRAYPKGVPRRPDPAVAQEAAPVPASAAALSGGPGDLSVAQHADPPDTASQRNLSVEALINKLSITNRSAPPPNFKGAPHTLTAAERLANKAGRLAVPHMRALLEEAGAVQEDGSEPDVAALAAKYRIDEHLLCLVLRYNKLPPRDSAKKAPA